MALRKCRVCGLKANTEKDLTLFSKHEYSKYGVMNMCKKCYNKMALDRYNKIKNNIDISLKRIHKAMINRCYNPKKDQYRFYGGRGITVCDEWRNDRQAFIDWALDNGFEKGLQIDRIDTYKGYSPENCRWVTHREQMRNCRNTTTFHDKQTRICFKCKRELPFSEFHKNKSNSAGISRVCKECVKKYYS